MNTIQEAKRYIDNARDLLREKAKKEDGYYQDTKYVKMAGHTAYSGVLVALDTLLGIKKKGRKDVEWYKQQLAQMDRKVLSAFHSAYDTLHLSMSYDGNPSVKVAQSGLEDAEMIINWVETRIANA
ncbi:DUF5618 family protein [Spirosoma montaniterrae]|uniref:DUF5618 domain-containing protein n=1 Tax=Spirosoma montaniterrae TaxID=1178516 RepID=A0A1P9WZD0_9BACT|nr:DUF5618 family protein [Spirosoma montaniterrae]AQG80736.1 hypothetical protein AWR27_16255 [Spirosoma montaniterrae]